MVVGAGGVNARNPTVGAIGIVRSGAFSTTSFTPSSGTVHEHVRLVALAVAGRDRDDAAGFDINAGHVHAEAKLRAVPASRGAHHRRREANRVHQAIVGKVCDLRIPDRVSRQVRLQPHEVIEADPFGPVAP